MRFVVLAIVLSAGAYYWLQSPQGRAFVNQATAIGGKVGDNVVGNLTH